MTKRRAGTAAAGAIAARRTGEALVLAVAAAGASLPARAQNDGLQAVGALGGPRWQMRFEREASGLPLRTRLNLPATVADTAPAARLRLLGDWQSDWARLGPSGGLRLTGGLLLTQRSLGDGLGGLSGAQGFAGIGWAWGRPGDGMSLGADLGVASPSLFAPGESGGPRLGAAAAERSGAQIRLGMGLTF